MKENGKQNTERAYRITENRVPARASTYPLERTLRASKSTGCMKNMLERGIERSSGRPVYKTPRSNVRYLAQAEIQFSKKCWEHDFPARAALPPLERTSKIWVFQIEFLSSNSNFNQQNMHVMAQISNIVMLTCHKHQNTLQWSPIHN